MVATSYQSHEHLGAVENLRAVGARLRHAYPNGFREVSALVPTIDLLRPPGPLPYASPHHLRRHHHPRQ